MTTKERFHDVIDDMLINLDEHYTDNLAELNRHQFDEMCHLAEAVKDVAEAYSLYVKGCAYEKMMDVPDLMHRLEKMAGKVEWKGEKSNEKMAKPEMDRMDAK